eukprot:6649567-Prymnesium_polylepis.2
MSRSLSTVVSQGSGSGPRAPSHPLVAPCRGCRAAQQRPARRERRRPRLEPLAIDRSAFPTTTAAAAAAAASAQSHHRVARDLKLNTRAAQPDA